MQLLDQILDIITELRGRLAPLEEQVQNLAATDTFPRTTVAASAPGVGDDDSEGYAIHSLWTDTTGPTTYICQDATTGAAVWTQIAP